MRLVHIMLFSFWTFSSLILGYVILWVPEGIQIGNRMLLSKTSICMWRIEARLVQYPILGLLWNIDQWCILAWKACKKNQICRQFVYWGNYTNAFPNLIFIINWHENHIQYLTQTMLTLILQPKISESCHPTRCSRL